MDKGFVDGLMRAELAGPGNWCPRGLLVGSDSQEPRLRQGGGGYGRWRCGWSLPGLRAGGESPRTRMHSPSSRSSKGKMPLLTMDAHFGVLPLKMIKKLFLRCNKTRPCADLKAMSTSVNSD